MKNTLFFSIPSPESLLSVLERINESVPILVKINTTMRSQMSSIMNLIGPDLSELSVLELEKLPYLTLFTR